MDFFKEVKVLISFLLVYSALTRGGISDTPLTFVRTNYGVVGTKVGTILNGVNKYRHTFGIDIKNMKFTPVDQIECDEAMNRNMHCKSFNGMIDETNKNYQDRFDVEENDFENMLQSIGNIEDTIWRHKRDTHMYINGLNVENSRHRRGASHLNGDFCNNKASGQGSSWPLGKFFGDIASSFLNLPTMDDIVVLSKHICESTDAMAYNKDQIIESNQRLSSITTDVNGRLSSLRDGIDNFDQLLVEAKNKMGLEVETINKNENEINRRLNFMEAAQIAKLSILKNLIKFQQIADAHIEYVQSLIRGLSKLLQGYLPQELVPIRDLRMVINHIKEKVLPKFPGLTLVHENPSFYYQLKSITYSRTDSMLYVMLAMPISSVGGALSVYRLDRTHLATSEGKKSSTQITNIPDFIAISPDLQYFTELSVAQYSSCKGENIKICPSQRALISSNRPTCAAALLLDNKPEILKQCQMQYEQKDVQTDVQQIGDHRYVVHTQDAGPEKTWTLSCPSAAGHELGNSIRSIASCNSCIIRVPCKCSLDAVSFYIPTQLTDCKLEGDEAFPNIEKLYTINLPVALHLFDLEDISEITGSTTHTDPSDANPLSLSGFNLTLPEDQWENVVEADKLYQIDLKKLFKEHKNSSRKYADKASALLAKAVNFSDLHLSKIQRLEDALTIPFFNSRVNVEKVVGSISLSWCLGLLSIFMSCYSLRSR